MQCLCGYGCVDGAEECVERLKLGLHMSKLGYLNLIQMDAFKSPAFAKYAEKEIARIEECLLEKPAKEEEFD